MPVIIDGTSGITTPSIDTTTPLITADGGTGTGTLTAGSVLVGNGTSAVNLVAAGTNGNLLTSNGTTWTSAAAPAGGFSNMTVFTSPGTFTTPSSTTKVKVTVVGGGGSGANKTPSSSYNATGGAGGGFATGIYPVSASTGYAVTIGAGGTGVSNPLYSPGNPGGTSSFGALTSATGGAGGNTGPGSPPSAIGGTGTGTLTIPGGNSGFSASYSGGSMLSIVSVTSSSASSTGYGAASQGASPGSSSNGSAGVVIVEY